MASDSDVLKAAPRAIVIRQMVMLCLLVAGLALFKHFALSPWVRTTVSSTDRALVALRATRLLWGVGTLVLLAALYAAAKAWHIFQTGQFPTPGTTVWRDTPILRGRAAQVRGWILALCAVGLAACGLGFILFPWVQGWR